MQEWSEEGRVGEEGEEDEPPLDFLTKEEEERECPVVGQCECELCLLPLPLHAPLSCPIANLVLVVDSF